jgi:hypothetical protein
MLWETHFTPQSSVDWLTAKEVTGDVSDKCQDDHWQSLVNGSNHFTK